MTGEVRLLGPITAKSQNGSPIAFASKREKELLATLAVKQGKPVSRDFILDRIWGRDDLTAKKALNTSLWRLRSAIKDAGCTPDHWVASDSDALCLLYDNGPWVDVDTFLRHSKTPNCLSSVMETVNLYRGDFANDLTSDWVEDERRTLCDAYTQLLSLTVEMLHDTDDLKTLQDYASRLISHDPFEEQGWRALIHVHLERGNRGQALRLYQDLEKRLQDELGVSPSVQTRALYHFCCDEGLETTNVARQMQDLSDEVKDLRTALRAALSDLRAVCDSLANL